jgi:hypothetical protein
LSKNRALLKRNPHPLQCRPRPRSARNGNQGRRAIVHQGIVRKVAEVRRDRAAKVEDNAAKVAQGREIARAGAVRTVAVKVAAGSAVTTDVTIGVGGIAGASKVRRRSTSRN